ncbi:MAG: PH domain-containing protein [Candidatus Micrarchaeaceae archaeon]
MYNFEKYADLDLPLVPGEKVVYITDGADLIHRSLVIATNKRLLLVKRGLTQSYISLFYNTISLVHFKGGMLMPAVLLKLNGTGKLKAIRTRNNITAKSLFSILSNRVIIDHDVAMTYRAVDELVGLGENTGRIIKENGVGILNTNMVEVVERIEEANGAFAEMVRTVENNVIRNAEAKKAANRDLNEERAEKLHAMIRHASRSAIDNTAAIVGAHRKPYYGTQGWIDFESAAKRLEKISISDKYDSALFIPQNSAGIVGMTTGQGIIAAHVEGMQNSREDMFNAEVANAQEKERAAEAGRLEAEAQRISALNAAIVVDAAAEHQDRLVNDMLMFKIRSTKEKLSSIH